MRAASTLTDEVTAEAIGARWLECVLEPASSFGRRARDRRRPFVPGEEEQARAAIAQVLWTAQRCTLEQAQGLRAALRAIPEPVDALTRAAAGSVLADLDLYDVLRFLDALHALRERMVACLPEHLHPASFEPLRALLARGRTRAGGFYLDDGYSRELAEVRVACEGAREAYARERARLREAASNALGTAVRDDGEFAIARSDLMDGVPSGVRVVREAATYLVLELANDEPAVEALRALESARSRVAECEERVRATLTHAIRAEAKALLDETRRAGEADLLLSAVAFTHLYDAVAPEIVERPGLHVEEGRLLPLERALAEHGRRYAPISLDVASQIVITGPNMGGKSAALRTAGFIQLCVQWGLPVPARRARVSLVERIHWLGAAGEGTDRTGLLSSFGSEIVQLARALAEERGARLLLIDEFARTTSPREGRALVIALLEELRARGEMALVTTHFAGVAEAAGVPHYAVIGLRHAFATPGVRTPSLEEALALIGESMDYRLAPAEGPQASQGDAIALARLLGLDERMTSRAARELLWGER